MRLAVYTTTLYELACSLSAGTLEERRLALKKYLFMQKMNLAEDLKETFAETFIDRFFMDEIGVETPEMFRMLLASRIRVNASYYNQLHIWMKSISQYSPMEDDIDMRRESKEDAKRDNDNIVTESGSADTSNSETSQENGTLDISGRETSEDVLFSVHTDNTTVTYDTRDAVSINTTNTNTTTHNDTITESGTDKHTTKSIEQGQQEGSFSNFPQGNVAKSKDYQSSGQDAWSKRQTDGEDLRQANLSNKHTGTTSDSGGGSETGNRSVKTGTEKTENRGNVNDETDRDVIRTSEELKRSELNREAQTKESTLNERIDDLKEKLERLITAREHGRNGRRNIKEIVQSLRGGYLNVPDLMCDDLEILFMHIY